MATNNIIPYAFTPGTKAKAEEVNANFNAIANEISDFKISVNTTVEDIKNELEESIDEVSNEKLNVDFSNSTSITNCILEAPNGVATYTGATITVKNGLKILIPNGRNADETLNNLEYTLSEDVLYTTISSLNEPRYLYISSDDEIVSFTTQDLYVSTTQPVVENTRTILWFNPDTNLYQLRIANTTDFITQYYACIGTYNWNGSTITSFSPYQTVELIKRSDKDWLSSLGVPDYTRSQSRSFATSYIAEVAGLITVWNFTGTNVVYNIYVNSVAVASTNCSTTFYNASTVTVYVDKGDTYRVEGGTSFKFYPLKGVN